MRVLPEQQPQRNRVASRRAAVARALVLTGLGLFSLAASGCAGTTEKLANLPASIGGLPADTPARLPADQVAYPAVHDMPPPRSAPTLTPEQVKAVEAEISFARARQKEQARGASSSETEER